mmetsp:Transcript_16870/g.27591  ORF Transcript_16870/g.27591 Transcript_16870/m.27591 type:complete len:103 (-) Transcript_16870:151-459(-)
MSELLYADVRMPLCNPFGYGVDRSGTMKTISGGDGLLLMLLFVVVWAVAMVMATAASKNIENKIFMLACAVTLLTVDYYAEEVLFYSMMRMISMAVILPESS